MSWGWAQPTGLSQPPALGLEPWASPLRGLASCPGFCLALPTWPGLGLHLCPH